MRPLNEMVRVYPAPKDANPHETDVNGVLVDFRVTYFDGATRLFAVLDPDNAAHLAVVPRLIKLGCRVDMPTGRALPPSFEAVASASTPELLKLVVGGGWDHVDLMLDPKTTRGLWSGLTLGEMAMSAPPPKWHDARNDIYPWEMSGWQAPGSANGGSWTPPALAKKPGHGRYVLTFEGASVEATPPKASVAPKASTLPKAPAVVEPEAVKPTEVEAAGEQNDVEADAAGKQREIETLFAATVSAASAAGGESANIVSKLMAENHPDTIKAFGAACVPFLARRAEGSTAPPSQILAAIKANVRGYPEALKMALIALLPFIPTSDSDGA